MQSRLGRPREVRDVPRGRREPRVVRRAVDAGARARAARAHPRSRQRRPRAVDGARAAGLDARQPRPHLRHARRDRRRLGGHARRRARARARARERVRTHRRAGHAARARRWRRGSGRRPTTTTRPRSTSWPTTASAPPGSQWYEISNWARPGEECRHNLLYWAQGDYAGDRLRRPRPRRSRRAGRRWWNVRTPERYIEPRSRPGPAPRPGDEMLDADARRGRAAHAGAPHPRAGSSFRARPADPLPVVMRASTSSTTPGCSTPTATGSVVLTRRGRLLANEVDARLLGALGRQPPVPAGTR